MSSLVYILGALVSFTCAVLLLRGYRRGRKKLLLWSGLCFIGLGLSNSLIFVDLVLLPNTDLYLLRLCTTAVAMILLLYGLVWESN
ncbi:MAG TPA: DUF5985 family protein [Candidatus Sulfotelmatobacter sp.]|nr:DUF5985 family protein [Candidatus Sulfotelmatobacter sp.]